MCLWKDCLSLLQCSLNVLTLAMIWWLIVCLCGQVLPVSAAEGGYTVRSFALLVRHSCSAGLVCCSGWAGRLWPRGTRARLYQRVSLRPQSDPWAGGEGDGAASHLQVTCRGSSDYQDCQLIKNLSPINYMTCWLIILILIYQCLLSKSPKWR